MSVSGAEYLKNTIPVLDTDMADYAVSLAEDTSLEESERIDMLSDFIESIGYEVADDSKNIASKFFHLVTNERPTNSLGVSDVVTACLDVIRAPPGSSETRSESSIDPEFKKELLKRYDADNEDLLASRIRNQKGSSKKQSADVQQAENEEDEILGLGRNENKLRVTREREELRALAKKEQEEAHALKVSQKLKNQADTIKHRTVSRKGIR